MKLLGIIDTTIYRVFFVSNYKKSMHDLLIPSLCHRYTYILTLGILSIPMHWREDWQSLEWRKSINYSGMIMPKIQLQQTASNLTMADVDQAIDAAMILFI